MKKAILGLRKRETYEELINDLNHDLITNYPDRRASELENSNYMSQLRVGFEEMIIQNDNLLKEKHKDLLLKEEAGNAIVGHHELVIDQSRWRPHVPPEPERFYTPERPAPAPEPEPLRVPVGQPTAYMPNRPEIQVSETRSRGSRKARDRNQPIIQEVEPIHYNIGSPMNTPRTKMRGRPKKTNLSHDVDPHVEEAHEMAADDEEMHHQRQEDLREQSIVMARMMLEESHNTAIDAFMVPRGDKRREEGADPKPAKPKAKTTKPSDNEPESQHEPKGKQGRPPNTRASASTDVPPQASPEPKAKASPKKEAKPKSSPKKESKPKAEAQPEPEATESKTKPKPVKKDAPKKNEQTGTAKVHYDSLDEWKRNSNKGSLIDQYNLRTKQGIGTYLSTKQDMKITVKQLIEKIFTFDNKNKK